MGIEKRISKKLHKKFIMGELIFHINKGDTIIDIGACTGDMSLYYSWKVGDTGKVIAIEPEKRNWANVRINCKDIPNITVLRKGLYKDIRDKELYISYDASHHSIYSDFDWNVEKKSIIDKQLIKLITLDSLVETRHLDRVDYIPMNVEGAAYDILLGADHTLKKFKPKIYVAPHDVGGVSTRNKILELLERYNYHIHNWKGIIYASQNPNDFDNKVYNKCGICGDNIDEWESARFDGVCDNCYANFITKWFSKIL